MSARGIVRECKICGTSFKTKTSTSAVWETKCDSCHNQRRTKDSVQKLNRQVQNNMMSLESRTKAMEEKFGNIELVIEVAARDIVTDAVTKALEEIKASTLEEAKQIIEAHVKEQTEKWQMQLLKMNNRIRTLTQELGLDD